MSFNVFLSYSHTDSDVARDLRRELESVGVTCFMAEVDIDAGDDWEKKIRTTIPEVDSVVLLITPRSRDNLWIMLEAGAAWVLKKPLIVATIYVDVKELPVPFTKWQSRVIEVSDQKKALANELALKCPFRDDDVSGRWIDQNRYTIFFQQSNADVIGFYDMGSGEKAGVYIGTIKGRAIEFRWKRLEGSFHGDGTMFLSDAKTLKVDVRRKEPKPTEERSEFYRVNEVMPNWLSEDDFLEYRVDSSETK